jgi:hypothetical protein
MDIMEIQAIIFNCRESLTNYRKFLTLYYPGSTSIGISRSVLNVVINGLLQTMIFLLRLFSNAVSYLVIMLHVSFPSCDAFREIVSVIFHTAVHA